MIPATYSEWRHCIEQQCGIKLTAAFIRGRLDAMADKDAPANKTFIQCYGVAHYERIIQWLVQAALSLR